MGSHERQTAFDLLTLVPLQCGAQLRVDVFLAWGAVGTPLGFVDGVDRSLVGGQALVCIVDRGGQAVQESQAPPGELPGGVDQLGGEHREGRAGFRVAYPAAQERVAVAEDTVEVCAYGRVPRCGARQQLVEVRAAVGGTAFHQLEVVGGEHGDSQHTQ